MNEIPGSSTLGYGFNALGAYDPTSLMSHVFTTSFSQNKTYTYQPTGIQYTVPDNGQVVPYTPMQGGTQVFTSQYDLQNYLAAAAQISVSYGAFSGQINASYESALKEWGSCYYALTNAWVTNWMVVLDQINLGALEPDFAQELKSLPSTYDPTSRQQFFQFFRQYGTHFVHSVGAGGYFSYYEAVEYTNMYSYSQVQANVALEYHAVFVDAGASSQADWQQLGQQWVQSRIATIDALGGNAHTLEDVSPIYGTNESSSYQAWLNSIESNPSAIQYILHGWDELLPSGSPQQTALQQALYSYMNYNLYVSAIYDASASRARIVIEGRDVMPLISWEQSPGMASQGIEVVVVDNDTLEVTFSGVYCFDSNARQDGQTLYDQLMHDLNEYAVMENQWCCCSVFNYPWMVPVDQRFISWLQEFGISAEKWLHNTSNCGGGQASLSYVGVGLYGGLGVQESLSFNNLNTTMVNELNVNPYYVLN